jgi:hypothetical protein
VPTVTPPVEKVEVAVVEVILSLPAVILAALAREKSPELRVRFPDDMVRSPESRDNPLCTVMLLRESIFWVKEMILKFAEVACS